MKDVSILLKSYWNQKNTHKNGGVGVVSILLKSYWNKSNRGILLQ